MDQIKKENFMPIIRIMLSCSSDNIIECIHNNYRRQRGCMRNLLKVEEAKGVAKDRSKWKEVISAYLNGKRTIVYVCIY
jgi:hypothetical protein